MASREVRKLLFSVVKRELNSRLHLYKAFTTWYPALFALRQSRVDLMRFQTIDKNVRTSQELDFRLITTSKNNLSELHISLPTPWDSFCDPVGTLSNDDDDGSEKVVKKMNLRSLKLNRVYLDPLNMSNVGDFSWSWILKDSIQVQKEEGKFVVVCSRPP